MRAAVFAYSRRGCALARRILAAFPEWEAEGYTLARFEEPGFREIAQPSKPFYGALFQSMDALIFVGAAGIAVREIAPHVRSKKTDPAVLSLDEGGQFVIPLLSGHIGGANALALRVAEKMGATPVVTTATDVNRRFSVDAWATVNGFALSSMAAAKAVSAAILERDVPLLCDLPLASALPSGVVPGEGGEVGIYLGWEKKEPFSVTLRLIPKCLHLGLGCRRDTPEEAVAEAVDTVLREHNIDPLAVKCAASIDLKKDEEGLLAFCSKRGIPIAFYPAEALRAVPGDFTPSAFVASVTGVDNVCERAALLGAGELIVKKTALNGVTVALAAEKTEVRFG
ncbi:MAG: cobalamin biosynthesis protein [Oscillospiraceae bacterium]|nr:cobalamin biosynthesis protein [Oscillospiraceae bacterium]